MHLKPRWQKSLKKVNNAQIVFLENECPDFTEFLRYIDSYNGMAKINVLFHTQSKSIP